MKTNAKEMLTENSKISLMRWTLLQIVRMSYLIIFGILTHIIIATLKAETTDWIGIGIVLAGLATFMGAGITGKVIQKKVEGKHEN